MKKGKGAPLAFVICLPLPMKETANDPARLRQVIR
jgi:hypothetical protein